MRPPPGWTRAFIAALSLILPARSAPEIQPSDSRADRIHLEGRRFVIHGEPQLIYSASFPYYACPQELWAERFRQIREAGFNAAETSVPWNWHERSAPPVRGEYACMDLSSLTEWLRMAHEDFGLYTILRPGPGDMSGWFMGGWPPWMSAFPPFRLGETDSMERTEILRQIRHWYRAFARAVGPEQITRKQPGQAGVILIGVDADSFAGQRAEDLVARGESLREFGIEVPLFTSLPWPQGKSAPAPLPMMMAPGVAGSPGFAASVAVDALPGESSADTDRRLRKNLQDACISGAAWVSVTPFVASTPPPGWQDTGLDEAAETAPIGPDGCRQTAYYAAQSIGRWIAKQPPTGRISANDLPPSSLPEPTTATRPHHPPIALDHVRIRPDDPARAPWIKWVPEQAPLDIQPGSRYSLFQITTPRTDGTTHVTVQCGLLRNDGQKSFGSPFTPTSAWHVTADHVTEWAPELAGIRERWYAPGVSGDEWNELDPRENHRTIRLPSADGHALWVRADFKTPDGGFGKDISWSARLRITAGCSGGIAYLNGQPLRTLPESAGTARILLPARFLHPEPGTRNTLTLLLIPHAAQARQEAMLDQLIIEPARRIQK